METDLNYYQELITCYNNKVLIETFKEVSEKFNKLSPNPENKTWVYLLQKTFFLRAELETRLGVKIV